MRLWLGTMHVVRGFAFLSLLGLLSACATNPVTGEQEISLVSERSELDIGLKQYAPSRQMQGGDYKLDPRLVRYVREVGYRMAKVSDRKLPYEFSVINDSTPNAWALPGGKIAINRGLLLELKNEAELAAVLGHEIVHAAARHGAKGIERGMLLQGAVAAVSMASISADYSQLVVGAAAAGAGLVNKGYSRGAELEADRFGMTYMVRAGYDPRAAIGLQETFLRLSKQKGEKSNWLSGLFASHPPSAERVEENRKTALKLAPPGGELGMKRYQSHIAGLKRSKSAYDSYDEGIAALNNEQPRQALSLANKAISTEPKEALFYALKGDALKAQQRTRKALAAYDEALAMDSGFFGHFLKRGELKYQIGDRAGAKNDLDRSLALLPTADAHYGLGLLAEGRGHRSKAMNHYRTAATSRSTRGKAAARALVLMDLPENPEKYLNTRLGLSRQGRIVIQLENPTSVAVTGVQVVIGKYRSDGKVTGGRRYALRQKVASGTRVNLTTDIILDDPVQLKQWVSRITRGRVSD